VAKSKKSTSHLATSELRVAVGISPHLRSRDRGDDGNVITKKREKTGPKVLKVNGWVT